MPKVSIIIPVYKVEQYLTRCLDSILAQSYTDWECILVDDGSPDTSGAICDEYAKKDARVKVVHKENEGPGVARNTGLKLAKGEYVLFIDSDDWVGKNHLEDLYKASEFGCIDLVSQGLTYYSHKPIKEYKWENRSYTNHEIRELFTNAGINKMGFSVGKLYKTSIIHDNNLEMDKHIRYGEDALFLLEFLQYTNSVRTIEKLDYFYYVNISSLSHNTNYDYATSLRCFRNISNRLDYFQAKFDIPDSEFLENRKWVSGYFFRTIFSYRNDSYGFMSDLKKIRNIVSKFSDADWNHIDKSFSGCTMSYLKYFLLKHRMFVLWLIVQKTIHLN